MISSDIQTLTPGKLVNLFELDTTDIGGDILRWANHTNQLGNSIVWNGNAYSPLPIEATGFEKNSKGALPRPKVRVGNVTGLVGAVARSLNDLVGAKLIRRRTFSKYLDPINFPGGVNPEADPNCAFSDEVWFVDRKSAEHGLFVEFELAAAFDVRGKKIPGRQCIQNVCTWGYRSAECGYAGGPVADRNDVATTDPTLDQCGKRLGSCKLRFGQYASLPFGGFPGVGLIR